MPKISLILSIALLAFGCAGITEVVPSGSDTYIVAAHGVMGWSSGSAQKAKAYQQANEYCAKLGKQVQSIRTSEEPGGQGKIASGEVEFRCINP